MGKYTRQNLIDDDISQEAVDRWWDEVWRVATGYVVIESKNLHPRIRDTFGYNGGDEDWFVFVEKADMYHPDILPGWLERLSCGDAPDSYDMGTYMVYVGSH